MRYYRYLYLANEQHNIVNLIELSIESREQVGDLGHSLSSFTSPQTPSPSSLRQKRPCVAQEVPPRVPLLLHTRGPQRSGCTASVSLCRRTVLLFWLSSQKTQASTRVAVQTSDQVFVKQDREPVHLPPPRPRLNLNSSQNNIHRHPRNPTTREPVTLNLYSKLFFLCIYITLEVMIGLDNQTKICSLPKCITSNYKIQAFACSSLQPCKCRGRFYFVAGSFQCSYGASCCQLNEMLFRYPSQSKTSDS